MRANAINDDLYKARETNVSLKTNLNNNYSSKDAIIANVNASCETGTIAKSHIQPPAHSEVTGTNEDNCHIVSSITGLNDLLSAKVEMLNIIASINAVQKRH